MSHFLQCNGIGLAFGDMRERLALAPGFQAYMNSPEVSSQIVQIAHDFLTGATEWHDDPNMAHPF